MNEILKRLRAYAFRKAAPKAERVTGRGVGGGRVGMAGTDALGSLLHMRAKR